MPTDFVDAASVSIDSEATDPRIPQPFVKTESEMEDDTFRKDTATTEREPSEKRKKMKPYEEEDEHLGSFAEGEDDDDAGILHFKGRKRRVSSEYRRQESASDGS
jgi:hypothetical protein